MSYLRSSFLHEPQVPRIDYNFRHQSATEPVIMTGCDDKWLAEIVSDFVTLYVFLAIMTWMASYGGAVIWQNYCNCLTVSIDSVKSQSMKRWLALSRFWNEIDWQFSNRRIVAGATFVVMWPYACRWARQRDGRDGHDPSEVTRGPTEQQLSKHQLRRLPRPSSQRQPHRVAVR